MKKIIILIVMLILNFQAEAHKQHVHQYISAEAYKLLKMQLGTDVRMMKDRIGGLDQNYVGSGPWQLGFVTTGAWREDEEDVVYLFSTVLYPQNNDSTFSKTDWAISLNTGYSPYGTGISIHKNISNNVNLEASFGVDLVAIPFLGFGPASNEFLVGIGGNYYVFEKSNIAINFSSFLHIDSTIDENIIGDKRYISIATYLGYIPRSSKDIPFFFKLGLNYDLKKSIDNRKLEFNFSFGLLISL